jgi:hypothetical protein
MQKMWKRIGGDPTHYCSICAVSTYRACKETWWISKSYPSETGRSSWIDWRQKSILRYTPANVLENDNFKLYWNCSIITDKTINSNRHDITFMNKTKNAFLIDIAVPKTHNLAKTITDKQNKYQELANEMCAMWKQNAAQVIPTVISPTGVIPKSLSLERLNLHPNKHRC